MLRDIFINKRVDTSQKARQFELRLYIQKYGHFMLRDLHGIFEIGGGGRGHFYEQKTMHFALTFI